MGMRLGNFSIRRRLASHRRAIAIMTSEAGSPLRFLRRSPRPDARLRLFCLPFAGGGASVFSPWLGAFAPAVDVLPVQLPGREERFREPPICRLDLAVERLVAAMGPYLDRPYALFGHSMGAMIAHRLAAGLRVRGYADPVWLFMAAHTPTRHEADIHGLPGAAFWQKLGDYNGTSPAVLANRELRELVEPMLRADFSIVETASPPTQRIACPWTVLAGREDRFAPPDRVAAWQAFADGPFEMKTLSGDHFGIVNPPTAMIDILRHRLVAFCS